MIEYPIGGPRKPVYDLMRSLGFSEAKWTDKVWSSADGIEVSIYGAGSMARISLAGESKGECALEKLSEQIDALRKAGAA
jgi:hypothetical protein